MPNPDKSKCSRTLAAFRVIDKKAAADLIHWQTQMEWRREMTNAEYMQAALKLSAEHGNAEIKMMVDNCTISADHDTTVQRIFKVEMVDWYEHSDGTIYTDVSEVCDILADEWGRDVCESEVMTLTQYVVLCHMTA